MGQIDVQPTSGAPGVAPAMRIAVTAPRAGHLLVVDDDHLFATALERSLSAEHDCKSTDSAEQALALIESGARFDVILCDLMMPDMSGMDLHSALRTSNPDQADRMIFLTGGAFTRKAQDFLDTVPNLWLEKPFDVLRLRLLVNERIR